VRLLLFLSFYFLKKINFFKLNYFLIFLNYLNTLISKINFKNKIKYYFNIFLNKKYFKIKLPTNY